MRLQMKKIPSTFNCKALLGLENFERIRQDRALAGICTSISHTPPVSSALKSIPVPFV